MSDTQKTKIAEALNEIDAEYITEYEGLPAYIKAQKAIRRRRINIATRVAACVAIVAGSAFIVMHDMRAGYIGRQPEKEVNSDSAAFPDKKPNEGFLQGIIQENFDRNQILGIDGDHEDTAVRITVDKVATEASESEIKVSAVKTTDAFVTLAFDFDYEDAHWYTGHGLSLYRLEGDSETEICFLEGDLQYRLVNEDGMCTFTYSWSSETTLKKGRYKVVTYLSDSNISYVVETYITVKD